MNTSFSIVGALAMLLLVSGCGSRTKLADLPPAPPQVDAGQSVDGAPTGLDPSRISNAVVPGSLADLIAQAGADHVLFGTDAFELDQDARSTLAAHARWLAGNPGISVVIEGHCDERGTREYNIALGERRALAAKKFLVSLGVGVGRLRFISYGKERPAVERSDEAAWEQNRRAVTVVVDG